MRKATDGVNHAPSHRRLRWTSGNEKLDPDKRHALPLIAKHISHLKKRAIVLGDPTRCDVACVTTGEGWCSALLALWQPRHLSRRGDDSAARTVRRADYRIRHWPRAWLLVGRVFAPGVRDSFMRLIMASMMILIGDRDGGGGGDDNYEGADARHADGGGGRGGSGENTLASTYLRYVSPPNILTSFPSGTG